MRVMEFPAILGYLQFSWLPISSLPGALLPGANLHESSG